jgi:hypothetical protein
MTINAKVEFEGYKKVIADIKKCAVAFSKSKF